MCKQTSFFKTMSLNAGKLAILGTLAVGAMTGLGIGLAPTPAYAGGGEFLGVLGGGLGGALIGNAFGHGRGRTAATAGGALIGAVVGDSYGRNLDYQDRGYNRSYRSDYYAPSTVYYSQPAPERIYYVPSYEQRVRTVAVEPAPTYVVDNSYDSPRGGGYCREYDQQVTVGGRTQASYGTACQQPDGSWKIQ